MARRRVNLKVFRLKNNLSQGQMAKRLGVSRQTYIAIENGQRDGSLAFWRNFKLTFHIPAVEMWDYTENEVQEV